MPVDVDAPLKTPTKGDPGQGTGVQHTLRYTTLLYYYYDYYRLYATRSCSTEYMHIAVLYVCGMVW